MDRHPELRYRRTEGLVEAFFRDERIGYARVLNDGSWLVSCPDNARPAVQPDYDTALRELVPCVRRYAWERTRKEKSDTMVRPLRTDAAR